MRNIKTAIAVLLTALALSIGCTIYFSTADAQPIPIIIGSNGAPTSGCGSNQLDIDITNGTLYTCAAGSWSGALGTSAASFIAVIHTFTAAQTFGTAATIFNAGATFNTVAPTFPAGASFASVSTATNCAVNSVSPAACGSAVSGAVVVPTTIATYTVNTTAVTAASRIFLMPTTDVSNLPSAPTCVAPLTTTAWVESARVNATSFMFTLTSTTGQTCFNYWIVN